MMWVQQLLIFVQGVKWDNVLMHRMTFCNLWQGDPAVNPVSSTFKPHPDSDHVLSLPEASPSALAGLLWLLPNKAPCFTLTSTAHSLQSALHRVAGGTFNTSVRSRCSSTQKPCTGFPSSLRIKVKVFTLVLQPYVFCPPPTHPTCLTSSPSRVFLLLIKQSWHVPACGTLTLLFPLPEFSSHRCLHCCLPLSFLHWTPYSEASSDRLLYIKSRISFTELFNAINS